MKLKHIYLAGGCFWGTEHFFKQIDGVVETEVGFANGQTDNPTYEQVYTDTTGHAETVHVTYDPNKVSLEFLLHMFFVAIDPTSLNKQGHDEGTLGAGLELAPVRLLVGRETILENKDDGITSLERCPHNFFFAGTDAR